MLSIKESAINDYETDHMYYACMNTYIRAT